MWELWQGAWWAPDGPNRWWAFEERHGTPTAAMQAGELWRYDGSSWSRAQVSVTTGGPQSPARNLVQTPGWFGPVWEYTRPPGLPVEAPFCGQRRNAEGAVREYARSVEGAEFAAVMVRLAINESGATYGRPADKYDNRPKAERPAGKKRVSAWGGFSFNEGAWWRLAEEIGAPTRGQFPWQATPEQEIQYPIDLYRGVYRGMSVSSGPSAGSIAVWLYHSGPNYHAAWRRLAEQIGWEAAAAQWPAHYSDQSERAKLDERAKKAIDRTREAFAYA